MSISPQSLARTRDKRSLRVPARYDDFSSPEFTHRSVAETVKVKSKGAGSSRVKNSSTNTSPDVQPRDEDVKQNIAIKLSPTNPVNVAKDTLENIDVRANLLSKPSKKEALVPESNQQPVQEPSQQATTIKMSSGHPAVTISNRRLRVISIEEPDDCKESAALKQGVTTVSVNGASQVTPKLAPSKSTPSVSLNTAPITNQNPKSSSAKKKTKGYSLIAKAPDNAPLQSNRANIQQSKGLGNVSHNMSYGARLLRFNEPIYLPRSVATIAPITTTLAKIANQARKRPFISERTESWISHLEGRKFSAAIEFHQKIIKVVKYLEVRDILNLRLANKSWKSLIDSDAAWNSMYIRESKIRDWSTLFSQILSKYGTRTLCLENQEPNILSTTFAREILKCPRLNRLEITTIRPNENTYFMEMLSCLVEYHIQSESIQDIEVFWRVKIIVDEYGTALFDTSMSDGTPKVKSGLPPCYHKQPTWLITSKSIIFELELSDLIDLYPSPSESNRLKIHIEPI